MVFIFFDELGKEFLELFFVVAGESMVGQSILLSAAVGDEIRLYNFGGDIYEDESTSDDFLHFVGVLLYSSDRS